MKRKVHVVLIKQHVMETSEEWWYSSAHSQFRQQTEMSAEGQLCAATAFTLLSVGKIGLEIGLGAFWVCGGGGRKIFSPVEN